MEFWKKLAKNRLLDVAAVAIALVCMMRIAVVLPSRMWDDDFAHYYVSSWLLLNGENPYRAPHGDVTRQLGFAPTQDLPIATYPPSFLWLFSPLAALPPERAFVVWVIGEVACLAVILFCTRHILQDRLSSRGSLFVCAAAVASLTVYWHFFYSQTQLLLTALCVAAFVWHQRGRHTAACILVAVAGLLKFYPFVLLPWFIYRSEGSSGTRVRRAILALTLSAVVVFFSGPDLWRDFIRLGMPEAVSREINLDFHYSLPSLVTNLGFAAAGFEPSETLSRVWWIAGTAVGWMVIALAYWVCLRGTHDKEAEFCLLCVATLLGTVTVQGHYFVWLIFPMAALAVRVAANPTIHRVILFGILLLLLNDLRPWQNPFLDRHIYLKILANNLALYGLVLLGVLFANELRAGARSSSSGG